MPNALDFVKKLSRLYQIEHWVWFILKLAAAFLLVILFLILVGAIIPFYVSGGQCQAIGKVVPRAESAQTYPTIDGYHRPEESTYLTFPEWYIVYSAEEYAHFLKNNNPSGFPYFSSVGQYWCGYKEVNAITKKTGLPSNLGNQLMLGVIGTSFSVEYEIKGVYENTIGRISELFSYKEQTQEDVYAQKVAQEYADFLYEIPWYEFPFASKLKGLWTETNFFGSHFVRKLERRTILSFEYSIKSIYGWLIGKATGAVYTPADLTIYLHVSHIPDSVLEEDSRIKIIQQNNDSSEIILIPRYKEFSEIVMKLAEVQVHFIDIAGNDTVFLTVIAPSDWKADISNATPLFSMEILIDPKLKRVGLSALVKNLDATLENIGAQGIEVEHVYDY